VNRAPFSVGAVEESLDARIMALSALFSVAVVAIYLPPLWSILDRLPLNYDEGWNAYHAQAAMTGGVLYPPPDSLITNNYPPLSFYLVGAVGRFTGDYIIAGRFTALASLLVVAVNVFAASRAAGAAKTQAWFSSLLLLAYAGARFRGYVAMDDPQWLAHALMTGGLVVFLKRSVLTPSLQPLGPALMAAGIFTKHTLVALPLTILIWCSIYDRAQLRYWLIGGGLMVAVVSTLLYASFGADFVADVLSPRPFSLSRLIFMARQCLGRLFPLTAGAAWLLLLEKRTPVVHLVLLWAVLGLVSGVVSLGGSGVSYNALFDPTIALCLATSLLLSRLRNRRDAPSVILLVMLLVALPALIRLPRRIGEFTSFGQRAERRAQGERDIAFLAGLSGPVACEMPALCYWAGKPFEIDFFNTKRKIVEGIISPAPLIAKIDSRAYSAVVLTTKAPLEERLPRTVMARLHARYRPAWVSGNGWTVLLRSEPEGRKTTLRRERITEKRNH
jgi:hypothetical protein